MNSGLGVGIALHSDCLAGTLASAGVGGCPLTANGKSSKMAHAPIALDALQALQIQSDFASEIALNDILAILNGVNDLGKLLLVKILGPNARIDLGLRENDFRVGRTDSVNVAKSNVDSLFPGDFNTNNTCHKSLN
jgi:hypothetical protein